MRHPNQGPKPGHVAEIHDLDVTSGLNENGDGFIQLLVTGENDSRRLRLLGQLTPTIAEAFASNLNAAANAARSDGHTYQLARRLLEGAGDLDDVPAPDANAAVLGLAAQLIEHLREIRHADTGDADPHSFDVVAEAVADLVTETELEKIEDSEELADSEEEE